MPICLLKGLSLFQQIACHSHSLPGQGVSAAKGFAHLPSYGGFLPHFPVQAVPGPVHSIGQVAQFLRYLLQLGTQSAQFVGVNLNA